MNLKKLSCKKFGFTLSEVLITLGIIGIVAAMTMPVLIAKYQKQVTVTKLKKVYSVLNQALKLSEVDNGPVEYWPPVTSTGSDETNNVMPYYEQYWLPYLKVMKICNTNSECGYSSNTPFITLNENKSSDTFAAKSRRLPFILPDGILVSFSVFGAAAEDGTGIALDSTIFVDLDSSKGQNKFGKDVFIFRLSKNKKVIIPLGYGNNSTDIDQDCSLNGVGEYCAAKIMNDGWQIKDDYPW